MNTGDFMCRQIGVFNASGTAASSSSDKSSHIMMQCVRKIFCEVQPPTRELCIYDVRGIAGILDLTWTQEALMKRVLVATSNPGKVRDLIGAAAAYNVSIKTLPNFAALPDVIEDGTTFEANARKKAEHYSKHAEGEVVIADDSGLEVEALGGAPGVRSARYAADEQDAPDDAPNSTDEANNARLLRELHDVPDEYRVGRFVCMIAVARNGHTLATFHGQAEGLILRAPRGANGFGYDPLFYFPEIGKTFAELTAEEKSRYSHRGAAFRQFLEWEDASAERHPHHDHRQHD